MTNPSAKSKRRFGVWLAILGVLALPASCITWTVVANPIAEWRAHTFCDNVQIGADLGPIVTAFDREYPGSNGKVSVWHYESADFPGHRFMFPGAWMDRANCDVEVDQQGRVVSKTEYMTYD
ncbi:MAG TPA: hypothetical protein VFY73_14545 [Ideonella sp.]|nr:hypothetical protein [Ideonella sp.]